MMRGPEVTSRLVAIRRGGVFPQKITDAERVLATVLYQRRVCTRQVLAELFEVTPPTIGNAFRQVRPLLEQEGYIAPPAQSRYSTALFRSRLGWHDGPLHDPPHPR